jgi:hypothetical protein
MTDTKRPTVFLGSSHEGLEVARTIQFHLRDVALVSVWKDGVFGLTEGTLESLVRALDRFDFAVLVITPDDLISSRNTTAQAPRDNVMFELGLFMGRLGRARTFAVCSDSPTLKLPSDLAGVNVARFKAEDAARDLTAAMAAPSFQIRDAVRRLRPLDGSMGGAEFGTTSAAGNSSNIPSLFTSDKAIEIEFSFGGGTNDSSNSAWVSTWRHVFEVTGPYMLAPAQIWSLETQLRAEIMDRLRKEGTTPGQDYNFRLSEKTRCAIKVRLVGLGLIAISQTHHGHETWELTDNGRAVLVALDQTRSAVSIRRPIVARSRRRRENERRGG